MNKTLKLIFNKKNIIIFLNLLSIFISFFVILNYHKYSYLFEHDNIHYYFKTIPIVIHRIPATIIYYFIDIVFPKIININYQDYKSTVGAFIYSLIYITICYFFTKFFFIFKNNNLKLIQQKNFSIIYMLSFLILSLPVFYMNYNLGNGLHIFKFHLTYFLHTNEILHFCEYYLGYIILLPFYLILFEMLINNKEIKSPKFIHFLCIISFLGCIWNELFAITTFFTNIILIVIYTLKDKQKIQKKYIRNPLISGIIGSISFFILGHGMSHDYNFAGTFITNLKLFPNFIKTWFLYMYLNKYILWIIIIVLGIISYYIYKKQQNINENKKYTNLMIIITSILAGYQLTCLGEIFGYQILPEYDYSFMREFDNCFYVHLLEIIILMLISYIYYNLSNKIKTIIINILITAVIVFFSIKLYNAYGQLIKYKIQGRINAYTTEKINLVYALLGESPIFCSEINEDSKFLGSGIFGFGVHIDGYKYINPVLTKYYKYYFKLAYGYDYNAYIFLTKDIMIKELNKRLLLFDDKLESKEQLIKEGIKFEKLSKKYGNKNLTLSDIDKIEKKHGKSDILTKARAYVYFKNSNYDDALKLYNEYLEKNPEDFDALINTAYMYENLYRNYKKAEEIYLKLDKMDPQNISFKYNYMRLLYEYDKNYTEALKVCDEIINSDFPILTTIYYNKGLIYQALNNKEKANEYFEKSKNEENRNKYKLLYSTIFVEDLLPAFDT